MQCSRCGQWNEGHAQICANCGTILPIIVRSPGYAVTGDGLPPWLIGTPTPINDQARGAWPAGVNAPFAPVEPYLDGSGAYVVSADDVATRQAVTWEVPFVPESTDLVPYVANPGGSMLDTLAPGSVLKSGRYRLSHQFVASPSLQPQGSEPPLLVANDLELGGERILIQELRLTSVRPEDADSSRRLIAQRFEALGQIAGISKLLDHFAEGRRHFLVFELPTGDSLLDRMQRSKGSLDETAAIAYCMQVLDILARFEQQHPPFVHGSLSPAHIILRPSGQVALVGYAPALLMHPDGSVEHGPAGGIPGYAPPEQSRGSATTRVDLFALCAVLHHAVTGVAPSPRPTSMHPPARRLNSNVSLELEEVLSRGLRPSSTQRFHSAGELREALQALASGRRLTRVPEDLRAGSRPPVLAPVRDVSGRLVMPNRRAMQSPLVLLAFVLALVALAGGGMLYALAPHPAAVASSSTPTPNDAAQLYQSQGIGLSAGEFVFDSARPDVEAKQRGAQALAAGDVAGALAAFQSAQSTDQSDAEAAIYAADAQIAKDKSPYVTVIAAVAFGDSNAVAAARAELQGVFLAQQHLNSLDVLPGGLRVRVLVLNSGQNVDGATTAAGVLLHEIQRGNAQHLAGIVGWPESEQTRLAISALAPSGLAILSPTATADHLGGAAGHFFAMTPSASTQAAELADAAVNQLGAQHLLVASDPQNVESASVVDSFTTRARQYASQGVIVHTTTFTSGQQASYAAVAQKATFAGDTMIFLAGSDQDTVYLSQAVQRINALDGTAFHILTGSDSYTTALFGVDNSPTAQAARSNPQALANVYVTSLADIRDFQALGLGDVGASSFGDTYAQVFGPAAEPNGLASPDATSVLSYDASRVLLAAFAYDTHADTGALSYASPNQIRARLLQFNGSHPYMGVGGAIAFSLTGSLQSKALTIEALTPVAAPAPGAPVARTTVLAVVGEKNVFCAGASCTPA